MNEYDQWDQFPDEVKDDLVIEFLTEHWFNISVQEALEKLGFTDDAIKELKNER